MAFGDRILHDVDMNEHEPDGTDSTIEDGSDETSEFDGGAAESDSPKSRSTEPPVTDETDPSLVPEADVTSDHDDFETTSDPGDTVDSDHSDPHASASVDAAADQDASVGGEDHGSDESSPPLPPLPPPSATGRTGTLERNLDRNIVGGVAAGLADYWGVSATWIRLGFAVLSVFGLLGVFVYGAAWILMPPNDGTESIADTWMRRLRSGDSWVGATLIALAALIVIGSLDFVSGELAFAVALFVLGFILYRGVPDRSPPPHPPDAGDRPTRSISAETSAPEVESTTPPPSASLPPASPQPAKVRVPRQPKPPSILNRLTVAALLITIGVMAIVDMSGSRIEARQYLAAGLAIIAVALLIGTWRGRARLMILPGLIILMPAFLLSFTSLTFDDNQVVTVYLQPRTAEEIEPLYRYGAGEVILDLSEIVELPGRQVRVELDAGKIEVILPDNGSVRVVSEVGVGSISDVGYGDGFNVTRRVVYRGDGEQLQLRLSTDFGAIEVRRAEEA